MRTPPPPFGPRHNAKSVKSTLKLLNQIIIKPACGRGLRYTWHFGIIFISLRVEVAQISDFLVRAKILSL